MAIHSLSLGNFKGIGAAKRLHLTPITIFIGANSSGKSSCIHALACLSQTLRARNNDTPLVLDDEYANVHLGRFIEVMHSKSYRDLISLGVSVGPTDYYDFDDTKKGIPTRRSGEVVASYEFKCSQRTQHIHINSASISIGDHKFSITHSKGQYSIRDEKKTQGITLGLKAGFLFDVESLFRRPGKDISSYFPMINAQDGLARELRNVFYLGPFRESPRRRYSTRGSNPTEVGPMGESAITMLANESIQTQKRPHINQIANWLSQMELAKSLKISRVGSSDLVDIKLGLKDGGSFPIADLGYGLSQVLPVLTQCSFAQENSTLLFEQPELHLHSLSARELAGVFIETARIKKARILIETHSPELVKQFINEMRLKNVANEDVSIYRVSRRKEETELSELHIEDDEDFDIFEDWEKGISHS